MIICITITEAVGNKVRDYRWFGTYEKLSIKSGACIFSVARCLETFDLTRNTYCVKGTFLLRSMLA